MVATRRDGHKSFKATGYDLHSCYLVYFSSLESLELPHFLEYTHEHYISYERYMDGVSPWLLTSEKKCNRQV